MENEVTNLLLNQGMLSFKQWRDKHSTKLANVSKREARMRYDQYRRNYVMDHQGQMRSAYRQGLHDKNPIGSLPGMSLGSLSKCSRDYATALIDPWAVITPPCIPDTIVLPSYKFGARARGTFQVGTAGFGFVAVNVHAVANTPASIVPPVTVYAGTKTNSIFAGDEYISGGAGIEPFVNDSALASDKIGFNEGEFQWRLVGCGLKIRYVGPEFTRGGRVIAYRSPINTVIPGGLSPEAVLNNKETRISPTERKWHYVTYRPALTDELGYNYGQPGTRDHLIVMADGSAPGTAFEYDAVWWFECVGSNLPNYTRSHSDSLGISAVMSSIPQVQPAGTPENELAGFFKTVGEYASDALSFIGPLIGGAENILPIMSAMFL